MRARFSFLLPNGELTPEQQEAIQKLKDSLKDNDTVSIVNADEEPEGIIVNVTLESRIGHRVYNPIFSYLVVNKELPKVLEITGETLESAGVKFEDGTEVWLESLLGDPRKVFIAGYGATNDEAWRQALERISKL